MTLASQYKNFSAGKLLAGITAVSTSCTLQSGQGSNFPAANGTSTSFLVVLIKSTGEREICVCKRTAGSDVITFIDTSTGAASVNGRAQESTTALAFDAGDQVELRLTAAQIQSFEDDIDTLQTTVSGISGDYLDSDHNPGGANEDDHDTRYYTQSQLYTQTELDTNKPDFTDVWTRAQLAASGGGAPIDAEHLTGKDAISHSQITDNEATKHRLINDSAGNGDTTELWSANKIYDQLAVKAASGHTHTEGKMVTVDLPSGTIYAQAGDEGNVWDGNISYTTPAYGPTSWTDIWFGAVYLTTDHNRLQYAAMISNYGGTGYIRMKINDMPSTGTSQGTTRFTDGTQTIATQNSRMTIVEAPVSTISIPGDGWFQLVLQGYKASSGKIGCGRVAVNIYDITLS